MNDEIKTSWQNKREIVKWRNSTTQLKSGGYIKINVKNIICQGGEIRL